MDPASSVSRIMTPADRYAALPVMLTTRATMVPSPVHGW